jgi:O-antigen ligase
MTLLTVPLAVASIWHFLSADFLKEAAGRIYGYDAPLTENPNDLALMLNLMIPLGVALFFVQKKVLVRAFLFAILCLDAVAVIVTFSRAGFVGLAITSIIYLFKFLKRPQHGWALLAMLLVFLSFPLLPRGYLARLATITSIESDPTGSAQQRWTDTFAALHYVAKHPIFGAGAGMSDLALNEERGPQWQVIHNAYLEYAVDLGLPGLVLFLFLLACCLKSVKIAQRRIAKVPALKGLFLLAEGIQVSLIVFAFAALFHPVGFQYYFYYLAGLAVASRAVCEFEGRRWSRAGSSS